jgi:predicted nuclease of predicted toxin-antitoxin system
VPAKLYLDDDVAPELARLLRMRGIDAISSSEVGTVGLADDEHLRYAAGEARVLLSYNFHDYLLLAEAWSSAGTEHRGIILSYRQFSRAQLGEALRLTLRALAGVSPEHLRNSVRFLEEFRS